MEYECKFRAYCGSILTVISDKGIARFSPGFWINKDNTLTQGRDAEYWVPPTQIIGIKKLGI